MATIKDWVRSDAAWTWIKANGYETFREHDALVEGVDNGTITEELLYCEDNFNFPRMPEGWQSVDEINAVKEEEMKKVFREIGIDPDAEPQITVVTGSKEDYQEAFNQRKK
jgi:hypothetical protein